jgi:hypothetical protein
MVDPCAGGAVVGKLVQASSCPDHLLKVGCVLPEVVPPTRELAPPTVAEGLGEVSGQAGDASQVLRKQLDVSAIGGHVSDSIQWGAIRQQRQL